MISFWPVKISCPRAPASPSSSSRLASTVASPTVTSRTVDPHRATSAALPPVGYVAICDRWQIAITPPRSLRLLPKDLVVAHRLLRAMTNPSAPAVAKRAAESHCRDAAPPSKRGEPDHRRPFCLRSACVEHHRCGPPPRFTQPSIEPPFSSVQSSNQATTGDVTIVLGSASSLWLLRRMADARPPHSRASAPSLTTQHRRRIALSSGSFLLPIVHRGFLIAGGLLMRPILTTTPPSVDRLATQIDGCSTTDELAPVPSIMYHSHGRRWWGMAAVASRQSQVRQIWSKLILTSQNSTANGERISTIPLACGRDSPLRFLI